MHENWFKPLLVIPASARIGNAIMDELDHLFPTHYVLPTQPFAISLFEGEVVDQLARFIFSVGRI